MYKPYLFGGQGQETVKYVDGRWYMHFKSSYHLHLPLSCHYLENYKVRSLANVFHNSMNSTGHFWDVSGHIMDRIENPSYLAGRPAFREYLISNPWKKINTFQCQ